MNLRNLFLSYGLIVLILTMPFSIVKSNTGAVEAESKIPLYVSISMNKTNYCVGDYATLSYNLSSLNGKKYSVYIDIIVYRQDGRSNYIINNQQIQTGSQYNYTGVTGNDTGARSLELRIRSNEYQLLGNTKCSYSVSNCNINNTNPSNSNTIIPNNNTPINTNTNTNNNTNNITDTNNTDINSNNAFNSVNDVIKAIQNSDSSIILTKLSNVKNLRVEYFLRNIHTVEPTSESLLRIASFMWEMGLCLSSRGCYDGVLYASLKDNSPAIGIILIRDKKQLYNPLNYLICGTQIFSRPMSIFDTGKQYQLEKCEWTIDDRFIITFYNYSEKGNNVKDIIINSLGGCKNCCKVIYIRD